MAKKNNSSRQPQAVRQTPTAVPPAKEPVMRRWPHPVVTASPQEDAALHYISCALSYQNQLLADIKVLLERMDNTASSGRTASECSAASRKK